MGADDYVVKPFSVRELIAPREGGAPANGAGLRGHERVLSAGSIQLDPARHEVR